MRYLLSLFLYVSAACTSAAVIVPKAPDLDARAFILVDAESGNVLVEQNADETLPPASLTKMLTSYIAVHELVTGNASDDTMVPISVNAWKNGQQSFYECDRLASGRTPLKRTGYSYAGVAYHQGSS